MPAAAARLGFCLILVGVAVFSAHPASAVDNGALGIRPANEATFFHLSVAAGATLTASAVVSNHTAAPVVLGTYLVDGLASSTGDFALASKVAKPKSIGLWSHTAAGIAVPARSELVVPFVITVPVGTPPGDYEGGLIIESAALEGTTTSSNSGAVRIDVVQRQGVRIYLTVPGTAKVGLTAQKLAWSQTGNTVTLSIVVRNVGNTTLHPTATVVISKIFGVTTKLLVPHPESVPPGATVTMSTTYRASPIAEYSVARSVVSSVAGTIHGSAQIIIVPWFVIVAGVLILLLAVFVVWRTARFIRRARTALAQVASSAPGIHTSRDRS